MDSTGGERDDDTRVRSEIAKLGDESSAPDVPPDVTARVMSALRAAPPPRSGTPRPKHNVSDGAPFNRRIAAAVGLVAAVATAGLGTVMMLRGAPQTPTTPAGPERIRSITVSATPSVPLSGAEIVELVSRPPDLGALGDPDRRASCLTGLGYPASASVLGARPVDINSAPAILLVLPGEAPGDLAALLVRPDCSAAHTGLIADTRVRRP